MVNPERYNGSIVVSRGANTTSSCLAGEVGYDRRPNTPLFLFEGSVHLSRQFLEKLTDRAIMNVLREDAPAKWHPAGDARASRRGR